MLIDIGQRTGQRPHHFRQPGYELVQHGGLVVFLVSLGLDVHRASLGVAFLENDFGFRFALRANGAGMAFGFDHRLRLIGFGQGLNALALDFGRLQHGGDQFFLAAQDFGLLHLYLLFLFRPAGP